MYYRRRVECINTSIWIRRSEASCALEPSYGTWIRYQSWSVIIASRIEIVIDKISGVEHVALSCIMSHVLVMYGVCSVSILTMKVSGSQQHGIVEC